MKKVKLISKLAISIFIFSLFAPATSAVNAEKGNSVGTAVISGSAIIAQNGTDSIGNSLAQLRKDKEEFKNNKQLEEFEIAKAAKEKVAAKRKIIEAKREELRIKKEEKRRAVLVQLIDIQIKQLEKTRERVLKMSNITQDLQDQIITAIGDATVSNSAIGVLTAKKAEVAVADAATPEQMKELAKEIKDLFKTKRNIVKQIVDAILASRADKAIVVAEGRLKEIKAKIAEMKTAGQDVADLESLLAVAEEKIVAAKTEAGKKDLKGVINELREAYKNMKRAMEKAESATEEIETDIAE